jgi:hypothetical protein
MTIYWLATTRSAAPTGHWQTVEFRLDLEMPLPGPKKVQNPAPDVLPEIWLIQVRRVGGPAQIVARRTEFPTYE